MRYLRQQDVIPATQLQIAHALVVGVGAIGRQVALQLTSIGIPRLTLIDFDTIEEHNLPVQGFKESQLGRAKVDAVAEDCRELNSRIQVEPINSKYIPRDHKNITNVVFSCVDSILARKLIFETAKHTLFVDGRMSAEEMRILTAFDDDSRASYPQTLEGEFREAPCTAKSTIYCSNVAAGMMLQQFTKWLRGMILDRDIRFSMIGSSIFL